MQEPFSRFTNILWIEQIHLSILEEMINDLFYLAPLSFLLSCQLTIGFGHRQFPPFFSVGSNIIEDKIYYFLADRRNMGCLAELFFRKIKENLKNIFEGRFLRCTTIPNDTKMTVFMTKIPIIKDTDYKE